MGDEILSGACRLCCPPTLPSLSFLPPSPPPPFPTGRGGDHKLVLPGATAPGTPALDRLRRWLSLPYTCPCGGVLSLSPAYTAFSFFSAPIPPPRARRALFPTGRGDQGYFMQGASPLASPGMNPGGAGRPCRTGTLAGGLSGWLPARPATAVPNGSACRLCRLPTLPSLSFLPPSPRPALAERSSQREGGDQGYFYARGYRPRHPGIKLLAALTVPAKPALRREAYPGDSTDSVRRIR